MAITVTHKVDGATRAVQLHKGLKIKHVRFTLAAGTDYTVGQGFLELTPKAIGMSKIWTIVGVTVRSSANNVKERIGLYDYNQGRLRLFEVAATEALTEIEQADLAAGDIIDCIAIGV